ncbi:MAG TPA: tetratricopeptide repeat protein [Bryobacteraceae bacterium]|nr:tetratricopeptide repeat protein [Bryobacteraceae bacterium]
MMIASMVRATGVLLIVAGGLYGATAANEAQLCANAASPDATIQQCTAAIASGGLSVAEQAAAFGLRCRAYSNKHDYARALADCERAVQLAPDSALQVCRRGWARFYSGNTDGAMLDFEQAIYLDPNFAHAYRERASVYMRRAGGASKSAVSDEQYDQAIRNLDEALRLKPEGDTYYSRGWCYFQKHSYDSAKADFDEAIRLGSGAGAYYYRGWCHIYKENYTEAIADLDEAIRLEPKVAEMYRSRAWVHGRQREYHQAIRDYTEALRLDPDSDSYSGRAWAYYFSGSYVLSLRDTARAWWRVWVPIVLVVGLIGIVGWLRKPKQTESPALVTSEPLADDNEPLSEPPETPAEEPVPDPEPLQTDTDLDVLIRTGVRNPALIGLAEGLLQEAGVPFFVMGQNIQTRQESGNFVGWWDIRVPHEREAEAREIIRAVEEMK